MTLDDLSREEIVYLLDLAADLKTAKREGREERSLAGWTIALVFETDDPPPTRDAFEIAAGDQGATVTMIACRGWGVGRTETVSETAQALGRTYDAVEYHGLDDSVACEVARCAGVPVYKGLTDEWHATQMLAAFLTFDEHVAKPLDDVAFCYLGDGGSSPAEAYLLGGAKLGMDVRIASPCALFPAHKAVDAAQRMARQSSGQVRITDDVAAAVRGCDVLLADACGSVDDPREAGPEAGRERIEPLLPYRVNDRTVELTGNSGVKVMLGRAALPGPDADLELLDEHRLAALGVTAEVLGSPASLVADEAENRMHAIKAVLVATLAN